MTEQRSSLAVGMTVFAATMLIVIGVLHALQGFVAVFNDTFYVVGAEWVFEFDVTTWGWIHVLVGLLVAVAGFFVLTGAVWARTVGVIVACLSIVLNFVWLPYYPVWGVIIIALDVFVVWALTLHGRDIVE
ncbi:DUF7144 family membrane protein [Cellulomonas xylanilytica]|uniref:DUF7144 domain-containing protein n=1 Tax=Cellulomonas xylanilytica TaxID=233583 RepID=A0A510V8Z6_9CELL|nr:hypothetical protein [Cellulomonas xylanilytica]GEK21730.1 hypothetical protein CXY01_22500 [Cellulomonas xylanilytica]